LECGGIGEEVAMGSKTVKFVSVRIPAS